MRRITTKSLWYLVFLLVSFSVLSEASAASFSVNPQDLAVGKETSVVLSIDTENQEINAVELRLKFSPDNFLIKDISDGNSIINLWIEKPRFETLKDANIDTKEYEKISGASCLYSCGFVSFSGIIPGGFQGKDAQLAKITLIPKKEGEASFEVAEAKTLLNDGAGTEAKLTVSNLKFNVAEVGLPQEVRLLSKDTEQPELFVPQIASDPNIFSGKYFLVFATQDKISGIAGYFVHESTRKEDATRINTKDWIIAESPYLLKDQNLRSYIYVKAVDKAGNARIALVPARNPLAWYENYSRYAIIVIIALISAIAYIVWRKL